MTIRHAGRPALLRRLSLLLAGSALCLPPLAEAYAQSRNHTQNAPAAPAAPVVDHTAWLYQGSDIPPDPGWQFGALQNGLRFAVRRNGVPPGQVTIRLRVDVGSLMERPEEACWSHLIEH